MKLLIVGVVTNPQLKRLQEEGQKRGHQVEGCHSVDLVIRASPRQFEVGLKNQDLTSYDLIYLWAFAKRRWEWAIAAYFLNQYYQIQIVNQKIIDPNYLYYLTPTSEYLKQNQAGIRFPKSVVLFPSTDPEKAARDYEFPLIVKISASRQGRGVYKIDSLRQLKDLFAKFKDETSALVIREFIPNDGDIRVFTIGFKAIGAMKRTPKPGDFRSNISQGGTGSHFDLAKFPKIKKIAEKLSYLTRTEIAGVDIMIHQKTKEPYVLEINPGPQFLGLEKYTPTNAALEIIKYFEKRVTAKK